MNKRVAIVAGARTPFVKAGTDLANLTPLELATTVVKPLFERLNSADVDLDELVFSSVLLDPAIPNLAREILINNHFSDSNADLRASQVTAHFVSNNCISGLVAVTNVSDAIKTGRIKVGIAGGVESMSQPALSFNQHGKKFFLRLNRAKSLTEKLSVLSSFRPKFVVPQPPSPKEPSTGLTMGQHCEMTAKEFAITREAQDQIAFRSHQAAAKAEAEGFFSEQIISVDGVTRDGLIRRDTTESKLSMLSPVFDRTPYGTLTAGNSSALTDGASAVTLVEESVAKQHQLPILGYIVDVVFRAVSPADGLLMAPALAVPALLIRNKLTVSDIDLFEIHEAFAAQVAANLKAWSSGWQKFPELEAIGEIPAQKINPHGGSLALGHPFAATGCRMILSSVYGLKKISGKRAVISVCAAGGMACAMLVETA